MADNTVVAPAQDDKTTAGEAKNYGDEIKRLQTELLEAKLAERLQVSDIGKEKLAIMKQKRLMGRHLPPIIIGTSIIFVLLLLWQIIFGFPSFGDNEQFSKIAFISGTFLSFIFTSIAFIKHVYQEPKEKESEDHPIKNLLEAASKTQASGE